MIFLCIPWKDIGDRSRNAAHDWCVDYWKNSLPWPITEGSGSSRSEMCNDAARKAISQGADVLVFLDADTWTPVQQIRDAVEIARRTDRFVHAFTTYCRVDQPQTKCALKAHPSWIQSHPPLKGVRVTTKHVSGASAISVNFWSRLGGFDERFTTWGLEDRAMHLAAEVIGGAVERIPGSAFHWWHRPDRNQGRSPRIDDPRVQLIGRYCAAAGYVPDYGQLGRLRTSGMVRVPLGAIADPDAMLTVLSEPGGPLSPL